jgi:hypothetical protein
VPAGQKKFVDDQESHPDDPPRGGVDYWYVVRAFDGAKESGEASEVGPVQSRDNLPPTVEKVVWVDETHVDVQFNEPVETASAEDVSHYTIPGLTVKKAVLQADGLTVRLTTTEHSPGATYTGQVEGVTDRGGNEVDPDQSRLSLTVGLWHRFPAGLHLMAIPGTPVDPNPAQFFHGVSGDLKLARWYSGPGRGEGYVIYPENPNGFLNIGRGLGYWLLIDQETSVVTASDASSKAPFDVSLPVGWNQIGNPYLEPLAWTLDQIQVKQGGAFKGTLADVSTWSLVQPFVWTWNLSTQQYEMIFDPSWPGFSGVKSTVEAWAGVWVKVKQPDVSLVFSSEGTRQQRSAVNQPATPENWSVELGVMAGSARDAGNRLGVLSTESQDLSIEQPPQAVTGGGTVDWSFLAPTSRAANLAAVFRHQPVRDRATWEAVVTTDLPGTEVSIHWSGQLNRDLPERYRLWLVDQEAGQRVLMNTRSHYTFRSGREGLTQRRFTVEAVANGGSSVLITNLGAQPTKGASVLVNYTLTAPAQVHVSVSSLSGQTVVELPPVDAPAGLNTVAWGGLDASGRRLPPGAYMITVRASTEEGDVIQAVRTVRIP